MRVSRHGGRKGISEFMGALIMIAITLVAGTAAFGWIVSQSGVSEGAYGNSAAKNVNFLNERFTLVAQSFSGAGGPPPPQCSAIPFNGSCRIAGFWLYNTGSVDFTLSTIQLKNLTGTPDGNFVNVLFNTKSLSVFDRSGTNITAGCTNSDAANGFPGATNGFRENGLPPTQLKQGGLSSYPYAVFMPTCGPITYYLFDGTTYSVTLTGLYGNVITQSFTPNG